MGETFVAESNSDELVSYNLLSPEHRVCVSPEMLKAGLHIYLSHDSRFTPDEIVVAKIFIEMCRSSHLPLPLLP